MTTQAIWYPKGLGLSAKIRYLPPRSFNQFTLMARCHELIVTAFGEEDLVYSLVFKEVSKYHANSFQDYLDAEKANRGGELESCIVVEFDRNHPNIDSFILGTMNSCLPRNDYDSYTIVINAWPTFNIKELFALSPEVRDTIDIQSTREKKETNPIPSEFRRFSKIDFS